MTADHTIKFEALYHGVTPPTRATAGSAGYDLKAYLKDRKVKGYGTNNVEAHWKITAADPALVIFPGERAMVPTGFKATLPRGFEAQVRPRSGLSLRVGLTVLNSPGTIDEDFPHEWMVLVRNDSTVPLVIDHEEKIAQFVLARYHVLEFEAAEVVQTTERVGGYGSTSIKSNPMDGVILVDPPAGTPWVSRPEPIRQTEISWGGVPCAGEAPPCRDITDHDGSALDS